MHPDDAAEHGIEDGGRVCISSKSGSIELAVKVTDEMTPGTVAVPHGWGHRGGWRLANATGGANVNALSSGDPADLERLAGMAFLNGIPIRLEPVPVPGAEVEAEPELASAGA
jgi:formate dehydrogenase